MFKEEKLRIINPHSAYINFVIGRFKSKSSYRGNHLLQHSRTSAKHYCEILKCLYKVKGKKWVKIPRGDEFNPLKNKKGYKLGNYIDYSKLCEKVQYLNYSSKNSSMSLKKIIFVDLERFGLLDRRTIKNNGEKINCSVEMTRCLADEVKISNNGIKLLSVNFREQEKMFSAIFKKINYKLVSNLLSLFINHNIKKMSIFEYTTIFSWIDYKNNNFSVSECAEIIRNYKSLPKSQKISIESFFILNARPKNSKGNDLYWDWGNWKNEAQTIFKILDDTNLFYFDIEKNFLHIDKSFDKNKSHLKRRALKAIQDYDKKNQISIKQKPKYSGFEHHHIIPISWINSVEEYKMINDERNILLISGTKHNQIPKIRNDVVEMSCEGEYLYLNNDNQKISLKIGIDVYVKKELINEKIEYNKNLLKKIF